jgi:hypothetical protein
MDGEVVVAILALIVALASFGFAWAGSREAARAEEIKNLLGEKETVGFGALKLLLEGLPGEPAELDESTRRWRSFAIDAMPAPLRRMWRRRKARQRDLVIAAIMAACLFERSDRARSLLYRVIDKYRDSDFKSEFDTHFVRLEKTVKLMDCYKFRKQEFNPSTTKLRLSAVEKVLQPTRHVSRPPGNTHS